MPYADREAQLAYWRDYNATQRDPEKVRAITQRRAPEKREYDLMRYRSTGDMIRAQARAYGRANGWKRRRDTGWTQAEYDAALVAQDGKCGICPRRASDLKLALAADHCHKTGTKRMLLCDCCNRGLGFFNDDPSLMRLAAAYVEQYATDGEQSGNKEIQCPTK
jgi:hypothetical protein